jgi:hypothetical protein
MTRKSLFILSATTAFLTTIQISASKETARAQRDLLNSIQRKNLQQSIERMLNDGGEANR